MPGPPATTVSLTPGLRADLNDIVARRSSPNGLVSRARIVLLAADGLTNAEIAHQLCTTTRRVARWRDRFAQSPSPRALDDRRRSGRPSQIGPHVRAKLISLACERPKDDKTPFRVLWTRSALRKALQAATGVLLSCSEIGRILRAKELRPHLVKMWLHSQDPDFDRKVKRVCDLYVEPPDDTTVLCVDEKRLFARTRPGGLWPATPGTPSRIEFEYKRHGSSVLLAAFNTKTGAVIGDCRAQRRGDDLVEFMEQLQRNMERQIHRVRENLRKYKKRDLKDVLNLSINETMARTFMTSFTTLIALIALFVLGGDVIRGFVFAMIWGVIVGTYSSIFVASTILL